MERVKKKYKSITRSDWDISTYHSLNAYSKKQTWRTLEQICAEEFESWMFERICARTEHWTLSTEYSVSILISRAWIVLFMQTAATWAWKKKKQIICGDQTCQFMPSNPSSSGCLLSNQKGYVRVGVKIFLTWESIQVLSGALRDRGKAGGVASQPPTGGN